MKIAILVRILWSSGTTKYAIELAKALGNSGHNVEIVFLRKADNGNVYDDMLKDVKYKIMVDRNKSPLIPLYDFITGIFSSSRKGEGRADYNLIRKTPFFLGQKFDLIICADELAGWGGYYNWKKYGTDYIVFLMELTEMKYITGIMKILLKIALHQRKIVLTHAKKVLTLTKRVAKNETSDKLYLKYGIKVINDLPGMECRFFREFSEKNNTVALISYWSDVKFPDLYLNLFEKLEGYDFLMIGNWITDAYRESFMEKLNERGITDKVRFLSNLSESDKSDLISRSKFYLRFGVDEEGPGYGTIEALELGVPIIVNLGLGMSDEISGYDCGLIVNEPTETEKIIRFIMDHDNHDSYSKLQSDIKRFINEHSWKKHCEILLEQVP